MMQLFLGHGIDVFGCCRRETEILHSNSHQMTIYIFHHIMNTLKLCCTLWIVGHFERLFFEVLLHFFTYSFSQYFALEFAEHENITQLAAMM